MTSIPEISETKNILAEEIVQPLNITNINERNSINAEKVMFATEISNKVYKPTIYKKAISNPIYSRRWKEAIKEEIQNLEDHPT